jgi:hypothetical protein
MESTSGQPRTKRGSFILGFAENSSTSRPPEAPGRLVSEIARTSYLAHSDSRSGAFEIIWPEGSPGHAELRVNLFAGGTEDIPETTVLVDGLTDDFACFRVPNVAVQRVTVVGELG